MAKAIAARRQGDEYQALFYWLHLVQLRCSDYIETVCLDSDRVSFVDDVEVQYCIPRCEQTTGERIVYDYYQCKYHVTEQGSFTCKNLLDPSFIKSEKQSLLQKSYKTYLDLLNRKEKFRLFIVSNWKWHPDDEIAKNFSEERIRDSFYKYGQKSKRGKIRKAFTKHLDISERDLRTFLDTLRFRLGENLHDLIRLLSPYLQLANLKPINPSSSTLLYDDLAWKLFAQGRNHFNRESFEKMIYEEDLVIQPSQGHSEISICSLPQGARRPRDVQSALLDLSDYFDGRFPQREIYWQDVVPEKIQLFIQYLMDKKLPTPIYVFFDCHLSIAFFLGTLINPKYNLQVIPAHKTRTTGYEYWTEPQKESRTQVWNLKHSNDIDTEVILSISVANPVDKYLHDYLEENDLKDIGLIEVFPTSGIHQNTVVDGAHAWHLGYELHSKLRNILPTSCKTMHIYYSGPAALAYILGNTLRSLTKELQLYEFDFEGNHYPLRYLPSIKITS